MTANEKENSSIREEIYNVFFQYEIIRFTGFKYTIRNASENIR